MNGIYIKWHDAECRRRCERDIEAKKRHGCGWTPTMRDVIRLVTGDSCAGGPLWSVLDFVPWRGCRACPPGSKVQSQQNTSSIRISQSINMTTTTDEKPSHVPTTTLFTFSPLGTFLAYPIERHRKVYLPLRSIATGILLGGGRWGEPGCQLHTTVYQMGADPDTPLRVAVSPLEELQRPPGLR
jgi:hypothetical protein